MTVTSTELCLITHMYIFRSESRSVHDHIRCYQYIQTDNILTYSLFPGSWNSHFHRCTKDRLKKLHLYYIELSFVFNLKFSTVSILIEIIHLGPNEVLLGLMLKKVIVCNVFSYSL